MTDWLSKLEAFNKMARRNNELEGAVGYPESPGERMARVLRELIEPVFYYLTEYTYDLSEDAEALLQTYKELPK